MIKQKPKKKKCKTCGTMFTPRATTQTACGYKCAIEQGKATTAKRERKAYREAKKRLKSRSDYLKEAQAAVNAYIRLRDENEPCISCGRFHQGQKHAGHYKSVGAHPELRFNCFNIRLQCAPCNNHLSGNIINYRLNLVKKFGNEFVERLEGKHDVKKYSIEYLQRLKKVFQKRKRHLEKQRAKNNYKKFK